MKTSGDIFNHVNNMKDKISELIELSLAKKNFNGAGNTWFEKKAVKFTSLPEIVKSHNYSMIHWINGSRKSSNFQRAVGFVGDVDEGLDIHSAHQKLKDLNLKHLIVPSKSHTTANHRFHFLIFFDRPVYSATTYKKIAEYISSETIPESDSAVTDTGRYIYGSPGNMDVTTFWDGEYYKVSEHGELWDSNLEILDSESEIRSVSDISEKTAIYCPFHEDDHPSAFIEHSGQSDNWFIHCSTCDETFWMEKSQSLLERLCEPFWSYGTDVFQIGILDEDFYIEKIGAKKFHILTHSEDGDEQKRAFRYLVNSKHIPHLSRIDFLSNIFTDDSYHLVKRDEGVIEVHYAPIKAQIKDNDYVEIYLADRFGQNKDFIKEWLAVFCYTNYRKLPTLIFTGDRGTGKSVFSEVIGEIFASLTMEWRGDEHRFTPEAEKKLLIVEENVSDKLSQYKILKKYSGQKMATVEKKFKDPYRVKNNMNIVLLSNEVIAMYVSREELPSETTNNQFFVYEFPPLAGPINPNIQDELLDRIGHYVRSELKMVFDGLNFNGYRYSIDVPITDAEIELFKSNATDLEVITDQYIQKLVENYGPESDKNPGTYSEFITRGYLPVDFIKDYSFLGQGYNRTVKNMKRRKLLLGEIERIQIKSRRLYSYRMTDKLRDMIGTSSTILIGGDVRKDHNDR